MSAPTYEIRTLGDFANVPDDRLDDCLAEFATAVRFQRATGDILNALAREQIPALTGAAFNVFPSGAFVWIDDGENHADISVTIQAGDVTEKVEFSSRGAQNKESGK